MVIAKVANKKEIPKRNNILQTTKYPHTEWMSG